MEKERFLFLLSNQASLSQEETHEINVVEREFPYSQVIHNLAARGAFLNNLSSKQTQLNTAAVYSTDRAVLKSFITAPAGKRIASAPEPRKEIKKDKPVAEQKDLQKTPPSIPASPSISIDLTGDDLIEEVLHDLELLKKSKHDFELVADGFELPEPAKKEKTIPSSPKVDKSTSKTDESSDDDGGIIAEIKSTKKKIKPIDPKQKEQLEIIDQFIKSKPMIPKGNPSLKKQTVSTDLSKESSVFSENIISETLAEILIKQGKKEKAVEVLRKLIWKFPQKKAYFAAQIEELTK